MVPRLVSVCGWRGTLPCSRRSGSRPLSATRWRAGRRRRRSVAADDGGVLRAGDGRRILARARQQAVDRLGLRQAARRRTDHLGVGRLADRQVDLGIVEIGGSAAQSRLGLGDVGRRDVAGIERRRVVPSVSRRNVTLGRCASTRDWLASTFM